MKLTPDREIFPGWFCYQKNLQNCRQQKTLTSKSIFYDVIHDKFSTVETPTTPRDCHGFSTKRDGYFELI